MELETRKKRILIFLPFLTFGGAERQGFLLAKGLAALNYQVTVCGFSLTGSNYPLIQKLEEAGIKHHVLPSTMADMPGRKGMIKVLNKFARFVRSEGFDCIIPFTFWPNYLTGHAARFTKAKCFWNQRSVDDHVPVHGFEKWLPVNKIRFVSNSRPGKQFLIKRFALKDNDVEVVNNGAVQDAAKNNAETWKQKLQLKDDSIVLNMVANFFPEKDFAAVIKGMGILQQKKVPVVCLLTGGGGDKRRRDEAKALAYDLKLSDTVNFVGECDDVAGLLQATDIGVLSSTSEGCPNSVLEYMMAGLPVVANDIDAITDVLGKDYPFIFKTGDAHDFAGKVEALCNNVALRKSTGEKLKQKVTVEYSLEKMVNRFSELIELK